MEKRNITILLILLMSMVGGTVWAYDAELDGIYYNFSGKYAEVTFGDNSYIDVISIPPTVTYNGTNYSVTSIGESAFAYCYGLTNITIPKSVTSIGQWAFVDCSGLTSISIPKSVTSIGDYAFMDCYELTSITIPSSVTSIGNCAFCYCSSLASITIPSSVTYIGFSAFAYCPEITTIKVASGNTKYDSRNNCNAIIEKDTYTLIAGCKNTIIPNTVTSIGNSAFSGCYNLTSITIPNSVTSIDVWAFANCWSLTSISIPNSVTSIGESAFAGSNLMSLTIPNSVTNIGESAFAYCYGLTSMTIPKSVISIGRGVFSGCSELKIIKVASGNSIYDSRDNCNAIIEKATNTLIAGSNNTIIPNTVTCIDGLAFLDLTNLTSITIPQSVTSINDNSFYGCSSLTKITVESGNTKYDSRNNCNAIIEKATKTLILGCKNTIIPNTVTSIGVNAFGGCTGLTTITIPNSVTSIGALAFNGCSCLKTVTIPKSVTSIGEYAFESCYELTKVTVGWKNPILIDYSVFPNRYEATLYVPVGSKKKYRAADCWNEFKKIVEKSATLMGDVNGDGKVTPADAIMILYHYFGVVQNDFDETAADLNGDGDITPADAIEALYTYFESSNSSKARAASPTTGFYRDPE